MLSSSKRMNLLVAAIGIAALVFAVGCRKKAANAFPPSGAVAGWEKTDETRVFAANDLWKYIDGEAEQYIQAGVVSAATSDYKYQGSLETVVDIYTMGDAAGARKIMETGQTNDGEKVGLGDAGVAYEQSVIFRKGPNLVRITAFDGPPGTKDALLKLARAVEAKL